MNQQLPFFNWSLKKTLDIEPDSFIKARIRIIYTILFFSLLKCLLVLGFGAANEQWRQVGRAAIAFVIYSILTKILLSRPRHLKLLAHIMILIGVVVVWTNIFLYAHKINLVTIQFVFMIVISSFYILDGTLGFVYSAASALPVLLFLIFRGNVDAFLITTPEEVASPCFEIIVVLNFITIVIANYLFYNAFRLNIQEKEKLNMQLEMAIDEANKLAVSKSNFLSTMSHELRTPLNSVIGLTDLLIHDNPEERQKENLEILRLSTLDLLSLINNVLDFNKTYSDKLELEAFPFALADFIQKRCAGLKVKAKDKGIDFIIDIDEQLQKICVVSDPTRLSQIIYNLVSNAIKFTDTGSVTIKLELVNKTAENADVLFSVTDTGIGINPDKHDAIFELFTQAESHITRKYGGTGLGLAIVKQILTVFNSEIQLQSSPGNGTCFFFTIPFITTSEIIEIKKPVATEQRDLSHLKILIAEDNELNRMLMKKQLSKLNLTPVMVEDGQKAYEEFAAGDYHAIFMDLHMPVADGYEATKQIRAFENAAKAKIHIIAFTATVNEQEKIFEAGFNDYLYKPVDKNELYRKLEKIATMNGAHS